MTERLLNCKFSYFQIKIFKISRAIEGVKPQFINLKDFYFEKKENKKQKEERKEYLNSLKFSFISKYSYKIKKFCSSIVSFSIRKKGKL